jgi:uncharacterized protein
LNAIIFQKIFSFAVMQMEEVFDPGHDALHLQRVVQNCRALGEHHPCDMRILLAAALLHDVVNVPKNHPDRIHASQQAADRAGAFLAQCDYTTEEIARVHRVILEHSFSAGHRASSIESQILQDADRLDALGAVGIMRTVTCGAKMGSRYYSKDELIPKTRLKDDRAFTIDHFFVKLFALAETMNTSFAKEEAERRVVFMKSFLRQIETEVPASEGT